MDDFGFFIRSLLYFHIVGSFPLAIRVVAFYFLSLTGMYYLNNILIVILIAIAFNYLGYDKLVFKKK